MRTDRQTAPKSPFREIAIARIQSIQNVVWMDKGLLIQSSTESRSDLLRKVQKYESVVGDTDISPRVASRRNVAKDCGVDLTPLVGPSHEQEMTVD